MINVLSISSDINIFNKNSPVRRRQISYGHLADEYHIIVFAKKELCLASEQISTNTWIYPTNSSSRFMYILDAIKIGKKIANLNLVTTQDPFESGLVGLCLAKRLGAGLHVQLHTDFLSHFFGKENLLNKLRIYIGKYVLKKADGIRVVSSRIKNSVKKLNLKIEPVVLPVYVDTKKFENRVSAFNLKEKYPQFENIIITNSRLEKEKNIELAILVFKEVLEDNPKTGYIIVGDGSLRNKLETLVKIENIEKNVIFVGWQDDLVPYYVGADIYLSTSNYEGYGLSMLEAVLFNIPVVSTDVGIAGDALLHNVNSLICPVGDKGCIQKLLSDLLKDENKRESFKNNSREISNNLLPQFQYKYFEDYRKSWLNALN